MHCIAFIIFGKTKLFEKINHIFIITYLLQL